MPGKNQGTQDSQGREREEVWQILGGGGGKGIDRDI